MQIQLKQLTGSTGALSELMSQPLPAATAFRLARAGKSIESELESYETARKALCERLGTLTDDGSHYKFDDRAAFDDEIAELHGTTVELAIEPLPLEALGEDTKISPAALMALDWLITE